MKKKEEVKVVKTSPKVYAFFFAFLVLEAIIFLSSVHEKITSYCIVDGIEYKYQVEKSKGIPWLLSIFNHEGISYEKCNNGDCETFKDYDLNKKCFERNDLDKSMDCARRYLCKENKESSN